MKFEELYEIRGNLYNINNLKIENINIEVTMREIVCENFEIKKLPVIQFHQTGLTAEEVEENSEILKNKMSEMGFKFVKKFEDVFLSQVVVNLCFEKV